MRLSLVAVFSGFLLIAPASASDSPVKDGAQQSSTPVPARPLHELTMPAQFVGQDNDGPNMVNVELERPKFILWLTWGITGTILLIPIIWAIVRQAIIIKERRQAEKAMTLSDFALNHAAEGIIWVNSAGRIIRINITACAMTGYDNSDLVGTPIVSLFPYADFQSLNDRWRSNTEDTGQALEEVLTTKDGKRLTIELVVSPVEWDGETYLCAFLRDVTERRKTRAELRLRTRALEAFGDGVVIVDALMDDMPIIYVNPAFEQITGFSALETLGQNCRFLQAGDTDQLELNQLREAMKAQKPCSVTLRNYRKDGTMFWNQLSVWPVRNEKRNVTHFIGVQRDVTKSKKDEDTLRHAATVFETTTEAIMVSDQYNRIKAVNPAFVAITGYSEADVIGGDPGMLSSGRQDEAFYAQMWGTLKSEGRWSGEIWNRRKSGEVYPEWLSISTISNKNGDAVEYVAVFSDISKKVEAEEQIRWQANYDALTQLPNRHLFFDRLSRSIAAAKRENTMVALLFIDLDRFKIVNDTLGHHVGDDLLKAATIRLGECVRDSDTLARFGGDEFTVVLPNIKHIDDATIVADKIISAISAPFELDGHRAFIGASVGITVYPNDAEDPATMLRNADVAMYRAKDSGRNAHRFFTPEMDQQALHRMNMENDIRQGIEQGDFTTFFQPIVDTNTGKVTAAEVLVRWNHPTKGLLMPGTFIAVAEETGLIAELGTYIRREALRQAMLWSEELRESIDLSINLSGRELTAGFDRDELAALLDEMEYPANKLILEITENVILQETEETTLQLRAIQQLGVRFSVDDFGTGYSSLSYLKKFPLDIVKIDRSFIRDIMTDPGDASLVEAVIAMAESLKLDVVAEGVETRGQFDFLQKLNCNKIQGYLFSHPISGLHFPDKVKAINANSADFSRKSPADA